jgi:hypothetical protein
MENVMTKKDIKLAFQMSRSLKHGTVKLEGWTFVASKETNMPRGGPMAAWDYIYTLVNPSGTRHQLGKGQRSAVNFADGIINHD